jgi:hypothetical protein
MGHPTKSIKYWHTPTNLSPSILLGFFILLSCLSTGRFEHAFILGTVFCLSQPHTDKLSELFRFLLCPLAWLAVAILPPLACLIPATQIPPPNVTNALVVVPNNYDLYGTVTLAIVILIATVGICWLMARTIPPRLANLAPYTWWLCFCLLSALGDHQGVLNRFPLLSWYSGPIALIAPLGVAVSQWVLGTTLLASLRSPSWLVLAILGWSIPYSVSTPAPNGIHIQPLILPIAEEHRKGTFSTESVENTIQAYSKFLQNGKPGVLYVSPEGTLPATHLAKNPIQRLQALAQKTNTSWLVGTWKDGRGQLQHEIYLFGGPYAQLTGKSRLVPFFERNQIWREGPNTKPTPSQLLNWQGYQLGVIVCYEMSASHIRQQFNQADAIIILANFSQLRKGAAFSRWQKEQIERVRLETRKPVWLVCFAPK